VSSQSFALGVIPDPIETQITDENAAVIVKAGEVLGEMIRRTRDQLLATGLVVSADDVVKAIADDIADGRMDGLGASRANNRLWAGFEDGWTSIK
jgi:CO dehydrogenase/acetyl-CoA synthase epsilon subunit